MKYKKTISIKQALIDSKSFKYLKNYKLVGNESKETNKPKQV